MITSDRRFSPFTGRCLSLVGGELGSPFPAG